MNAPSMTLLMASWLAWGGSAEAALTYSGRLDDPSNPALVGSDLGAPSFVDDSAVANNVALYDVIVPLDGLVEIRSTGFSASGVDPYFTLFRGSSNAATFVDSNYVQAFSTGGDFDFAAVLPQGSYRIALGAFANMSFAENIGSGTLGDGFIGLGEPSALGDTHYELIVTTPVPEPSAGTLMALGLALTSLVLLGKRPGHRAAPSAPLWSAWALGDCPVEQAGA